MSPPFPMALIRTRLCSSYFCF